MKLRFGRCCQDLQDNTIYEDYAVGGGERYRQQHRAAS